MPRRKKSGHTLPTEQGPLLSWKATASLLEDLHSLLLMTLEPGDARQRLVNVMNIFKSQSVLCMDAADNAAWASELSEKFLQQLPTIRQTLLDDIEAALQGI